MSKKHKTRGNRDRSFQSNGKGDSDRTTDVDAFRRNFDEINWGHKGELHAKVTPRRVRGILTMAALMASSPLYVPPPFDSLTRGL